ncbi:hypothetical protein CEXT_63881 [Caerostris extrusa]|uniref:Uncharacterized protein n=1 Tax=Caerostris extrusa TaxID=172846 RepID=A0AAV4VJG8_CAEEX|nr:hypothetical protein CEXT_63881 [Caerostris extrusa]
MRLNGVLFNSFVTVRRNMRSLKEAMQKGKGKEIDPRRRWEVKKINPQSKCNLRPASKIYDPLTVANNRFLFLNTKLVFSFFSIFSSCALSPRDSFVLSMKRLDRKTIYKNLKFALRGVCTEGMAFERLKIFALKAAWMHCMTQ